MYKSRKADKKERKRISPYVNLERRYTSGTFEEEPLKNERDFT